jgi:hypothetical protein
MYERGPVGCTNDSKKLRKGWENATREACSELVVGTWAWGAVQRAHLQRHDVLPAVIPDLEDECLVARLHHPGLRMRCCDLEGHEDGHLAAPVPHHLVALSIDEKARFAFHSIHKENLRFVFKSIQFEVVSSARTFQLS